MPNQPDPTHPRRDDAESSMRFPAHPGMNLAAILRLRALIAADRYESPEKIEAAIDKMTWPRAA